MSLPAFAHLDHIERELRRHREWHFLLDFDGTLAPIVNRPEDAELDPQARLLLAALTSLPGVHVSIVSGRALADLQSRVPSGLSYAGNHGLEMEGPNVHFREPSVNVNALRTLLVDLRAALEQIPGIVVEDKELTASVHFRNADSSSESTIHDIVMRHIRGMPFHLRKGKKVLEIRPDVAWHKGKAAHYLLKQTPEALPVAIGDDETDEDTFRALPEAVSVRVGDDTQTAARYYVDDQPSAVRLLKRISLCLEDAGRDRRPR